MASKMISSNVYDENYYMTNLEGYKDYEKFLKTKGNYLNPRFKTLLSYAKIKKGEKILAVACGRAEYAIKAALEGCEVIGIDYSKDSINICKRSIKNFPPEVKSRLSFFVQDCTSLSFKNATFDKVFMFDIVEHLFPQDLHKALSEAHRVLKENGILYVHTMPNKLFYQVAYPPIRILYPVIKKVVPDVKKLVATKPNWSEEGLPKDPEDGQLYNQKVHVNILNPFSLKKYLVKNNFKVKIKMIPFTKKKSSPQIKLIYFLCNLPILKYFLSAEILAIAKK